MPTFFRKNFLLVVGSLMLGLSLVFSTISVVKVMSAPLAAPVSVPTTVGFEGFLAGPDGKTGIADATYSMTFAIHDDNGVRWSQQSSVQVANGLYTIQLNVPQATDSLWSSPRLYIGVNLSGTEMTPFTPISAVPFALNAVHANSAETAITATTALNANQLNNWSAATSGANQHVLATDGSGSITLSGDETYSGQLKPVRGANTYTGYVYVPLAYPLLAANGYLVGGALGPGTYVIGPTGDSGANFTFNYPTTAKALYVQFGAVWSGVSASNYATMRTTGDGNTIGVISRGIVANIGVDGDGIVNLDANNGRVLLTVNSGACSGLWVKIMGYFI